MSNYVYIGEEVVDSALKWAKQNCPTYITNDGFVTVVNNRYRSVYRFYFLDSEQGEKEKMWFTLRWT